MIFVTVWNIFERLKRILELQERSSSPSFSYTKILLGERINFLEFQFGCGVCKLFLSLHSHMHIHLCVYVSLKALKIKLFIGFLGICPLDTIRYEIVSFLTSLKFC